MKLSRRNFLQALAAAAARALFPKAEKVEADPSLMDRFMAGVADADPETALPGLRPSERRERIAWSGDTGLEWTNLPSEPDVSMTVEVSAGGDFVDADRYAFEWTTAEDCNCPECTEFDASKISFVRSSEPEPVSEHTSDGWPVSDAHVFVVRPGNEWLPFDSVGDAVDFVGEHATPSEPIDVTFMLPGDRTIDET